MRCSAISAAARAGRQDGFASVARYSCGLLSHFAMRGNLAFPLDSVCELAPTAKCHWHLQRRAMSKMQNSHLDNNANQSTTTPRLTTAPAARHRQSYALLRCSSVNQPWGNIRMNRHAQGYCLLDSDGARDVRVARALADNGETHYESCQLTCVSAVNGDSTSRDSSNTGNSNDQLVQARLAAGATIVGVDQPASGKGDSGHRPRLGSTVSGTRGAPSSARPGESSSS